jgi:WD40 repeat protein
MNEQQRLEFGRFETLTGNASGVFGHQMVGDRLYTSAVDNTVRLWDLRSLQVCAFAPRLVHPALYTRHPTLYALHTAHYTLHTTLRPFQDRGREGGVVAATSRDTITPHI